MSKQTPQTIGNTENGEFIHLVNSKGEPQKKIYSKDGYCRFNKKYELTDVDDFCRTRYVKKSQLVIIADY